MGASAGAGLGLRPDARSLVEALERCAMPVRLERDASREVLGGKSEKEREREVALGFAEDVWREWEGRGFEERWLEGQNEKEDSKVVVSARMVERANAAMIRILALCVFAFLLLSANLY